uniref:Type II secretion system protein I n=1 Tax=uncultured Thiotrichaceae bacterium TaxID=298394 RepID=A0A6S6UE29_9GAMM|nr:MAG: Type II secretion system protein I [uncultured Thiotrichaceae bacterium]
MMRIRPVGKCQHSKNKGFSLIEVMFALFLIVMVIGVATEVAGNSVRNATSLKESTFARWVGFNQLDMYKIEVAQGARVVGVGIDEGEAEMGNMQWRWVREVGGSNSADLLEMKVSVYREADSRDDDPVITVKGYIASPDI